MKKGVLRNFPKFTGKHLCNSLFFNKVADLSPATLLEKKLWNRCFPVNFRNLLEIPFLQNTSGRLLLDLIMLFFLDKTRVISLAYIFLEPVAWWCSATKDALKNFTKFTEKYLC